jgi:phasin family protein
MPPAGDLLEEIRHIVKNLLDALQQYRYIASHQINRAMMELTMNTSYVPHLEALTKASLEATKTLGALNYKLADKLVAKQFEILGLAADTGSRATGAFRQGKRVTEFLAEQTKLANEYGQKLSAAARETGEILTSGAKEYRAWLQESFKTLSTQGRTVVESVVPSAEKSA